MRALPITAYTTTSAAGTGKAATWASILAERSGLAPNDLAWAPLPCWIGRVREEEGVRVPEALRDFDCANARLALLALEQDGFHAAVARARDRHGPARIGVFLGTTTSGIRSTEEAYTRRDPATGRLPAGFDYERTHNLDATTEFTRRVLGLAGPALTVSTACSSSAKVFAVAERHLAAGLIDAAVVGGVDTLCQTTLYGFSSLQLVSDEVCRPCDAQRRGLTLGEGAGFALLEREGDVALGLEGYGETCDAHHMSTPHPEGEGARRAIEEALMRAGLEAGAIDYVNLHGTASAANDLAEGRAVHDVFGSRVPCSSTKGFTGHTLGAAGITEAAIALMALEHGFIPGSPTTRTVDPLVRATILLRGQPAALRHVVSNSFGFGGNNCALVFGRGA